MDAKAIVPLLKETFSDWNEDKAPRLAAALAYYTVFSIAPLLFIIAMIAGLFSADAGTQLPERAAGLVPGGGGEALRTMLEGVKNNQSAGIVATIIGFVTLLFGAAGLFGQLQEALNTVWEVQPKPNQGILATVKQRFFSFTMVLGTAFLLLVTLVASSVLSTMTKTFQEALPGSDIIWTIVNILVSVALTAVIFGLIYKIVPDAEIDWGDVRIGALATAVLFTLGQLILGWYLGDPDRVSVYGAFGSLIVLLLWVYYSAQILFLGAEFTQVYAKNYGSRIQPSENAIALTEEARAQQGIPSKEYAKQAVAQQERGASGVARTHDTERPPIVRPTEPSKPGAITTAVGFLLGWILGKRNKT